MWEEDISVINGNGSNLAVILTFLMIQAFLALDSDLGEIPAGYKALKGSRNLT